MLDGDGKWVCSIGYYGLYELGFKSNKGGYFSCLQGSHDSVVDIACLLNERFDLLEQVERMEDEIYNLQLELDD